MLGSLGHTDREDSVRELGRDVIGRDLAREVENPAELADAALRDPVLGVVDRAFLLLLLLAALVQLGDSSGRCGLGGGVGFVVIVLNSGLVRGAGAFLAVGDGTAHLIALLEETSGGSTRGVGALDAAPNMEGVGVGELDGDVLLLQAGELAVKLIGILDLADIELGLEGRDVVAVGAAGGAVLTALAGIVVEVLQKTEERSEGGVRVVEVAGEESGHFDRVG